MVLLVLSSEIHCW